MSEVVHESTCSSASSIFHSDCFFALWAPLSLASGSWIFCDIFLAAKHRPMATFQLPALRHTFTNSAPLLLRGTQRRWAQVHDVRLLVTHQQPDRVIEKYREKLDRKAKE